MYGSFQAPMINVTPSGSRRTRTCADCITTGVGSCLIFILSWISRGPSIEIATRKSFSSTNASNSSSISIPLVGNVFSTRRPGLAYPRSSWTEPRTKPAPVIVGSEPCQATTTSSARAWASSN